MVPRLFGAILLLGLGSASAQVVCYEGDTFPEDAPDPWTLVGAWCDPTRWLDGGWFYQESVQCPGFPPPAGQQEYLQRALDAFVGEEHFWIEFHMQSDGDSSEMNGTAPASLTAGSFFGVNYQVVISRDLVQLWRDNFLPIIWVEIDPDVPHTYRLELFGEELYVWYIDGQIADAGVPEGAFPPEFSVVLWGARAWFLENTTKWSYVRYGKLPVDFSGDFDSSSTVELFDFRYFQECIAERGNGPGATVDPGCEWADMDADGDVDFHDFGHFQQMFTGPE